MGNKRIFALFKRVSDESLVRRNIESNNPKLTLKQFLKIKKLILTQSLNLTKQKTISTQSLNLTKNMILALLKKKMTSLTVCYLRGSRNFQQRLIKNFRNLSAKSAEILNLQIKSNLKLFEIKEVQ